VARKGLADGVVPPDPEAFHRLLYEELAAPEIEHHTVRLNRQRAIRLPSAAHAEELATLIAELRPLGVKKRRVWLDRRRDTTDLSALRRQEARLRKLGQPLRLLCWLLFVVTFGVLPAVTFLSDGLRLLGAVLLFLAGGYLLLLIEVVLFVRRVGREQIARTRGILLPVLLSPPAALRAPLNLTRDLCHRFDDLTLAAACLPDPEFLRRAHSELQAADLALAHEAGSDWRWLWQRRRDQLVALLAELGLSEAKAMAPPSRQDPAARVYCPLCYGEYRQAERCDGCDVPLLPFAEEVS
jgi:hypothetical protein